MNKEEGGETFYWRNAGFSHSRPPPLYIKTHARVTPPPQCVSGAVCHILNKVPKVRGAPTPRGARRTLVARRAEQTTGPEAPAKKRV